MRGENNKNLVDFRLIYCRQLLSGLKNFRRTFNVINPS